jgi:hypothetical protein
MGVGSMDLVLVIRGVAMVHVGIADTRRQRLLLVRSVFVRGVFVSHR